jgi:homospermidine synthase
VHIAERDTQRAKTPKPRNVFVNTWSIEGFLSEGMQPAELGWGTHEKWAPANAGFHKEGCGAAIYLLQPGANTRVRSWTPTAQGQFGFLVTHNEAISIADYYTLRDAKGEAIYRPTCHYAYHPCDDAVLSLHELFGRAGKVQPEHHILGEAEIADGIDELGVLLYGHARNAYWYGSQLSVEETRELAPYQNATGMQVTSAVLAGMVWALENPNAGIVEADEMDYRRCLEVQMPYLGPVIGAYTDWTPLTDRPGLFPEDIDESDPWQFRNVLVSARVVFRLGASHAESSRQGAGLGAYQGHVGRHTPGDMAAIDRTRLDGPPPIASRDPSRDGLGRRALACVRDRRRSIRRPRMDGRRRRRRREDDDQETHEPRRLALRLHL